MHGSSKFSQRGPGNVFFFLFFLSFLVINIFHRGPYGPPLRSNWTNGSNCISMAASTCILRKHSATCFFQGTLDPPPSGSAHGIAVQVCSYYLVYEAKICSYSLCCITGVKASDIYVFLYIWPEGKIFLSGIFLSPVNCTVLTRGILVVRGY